MKITDKYLGDGKCQGKPSDRIVCGNSCAGSCVDIHASPDVQRTQCLSHDCCFDSTVAANWCYNPF